MLKKLKGDKKSNNIKFGCYIYQDSLGYKDIKHIALECEKLGYDSVWLKDNFIPWIQDTQRILKKLITIVFLNHETRFQMDVKRSFLIHF